MSFRIVQLEREIAWMYGIDGREEEKNRVGGRREEKICQHATEPAYESYQLT